MRLGAKREIKNEPILPPNDPIKDFASKIKINITTVFDNEDRVKFNRVLKERRAERIADEKKAKRTFFGKVKYFFKVRRLESDDGTGYVYVMADKEYVKIGFSINPEQRLESIERTVPGTKLVKAIWFENMREAKALAHHHFRAKRIFKHHGQTEWFDIDSDIAVLKLQKLKPLINLIGNGVD